MKPDGKRLLGACPKPQMVIFSVQTAGSLSGNHSVNLIRRIIAEMAPIKIRKTGNFPRQRQLTGIPAIKKKK